MMSSTILLQLQQLSQPPQPFPFPNQTKERESSYFLIIISIELAFESSDLHSNCPTPHAQKSSPCLAIIALYIGADQWRKRTFVPPSCPHQSTGHWSGIDRLMWTYWIKRGGGGHESGLLRITVKGTKDERLERVGLQFEFPDGREDGTFPPNRFPQTDQLTACKGIRHAIDYTPSLISPSQMHLYT